MKVLPSRRSAMMASLLSPLAIAGWARSVRADVEPRVKVMVPDYRGGRDRDDSAAVLRAIDAAAGRGGGAVHFPDGDYLLSETIEVGVENMTLAGESRASTRLLRRSDYGPTVRFRGRDGPDGVLNQVFLHDLWLIDTDRSMSAGKSPHHLVFDYTAHCGWRDLTISEGGGIALLGAHDLRHADTLMSITRGRPEGRSGLFVGAPTVRSPFSGHGGDILGRGLNLYAGASVGAPALDVGIDIHAVDGFWLAQSHVIHAGEAQLRLRADLGESCGNIFMTDVMLDIGRRHGLVIDGTDLVEACDLDLVISCDGRGGADGHGVMKTGPSRGVALKANVLGYRSDAVVWKGPSHDDTLEFGRVQGAADAGSMAALVVDGMNGGTMRLGSIGTNGEFTTGIRVGPNVRDLSIEGGRLGTMRDGGAGLEIESGFGGRLKVSNLDVSQAVEPLRDRSNGGERQFNLSPGLSPAIPGGSGG